MLDKKLLQDVNEFARRKLAEGCKKLGLIEKDEELVSDSNFVKANLMVFFAFLQVENATKFAFAKANTCHVKSYNTPKLMIFVSFGAL